MNNLIIFDFDGVFTDNMVYVLEDGSEAVRCNRSDGFGLQKLKKFNLLHIKIQDYKLYYIKVKLGEIS